MWLTCSFILTYLLTPCSRVLLEKITGFQLKKFLAFYGTWRFMTTVTSARHLSLFWASLIQSTPPYPISQKSILILSSHLSLGLPSYLFPSGFPTKTCIHPSSPCATRPAHLILLDLITQTILGEEYRSLSFSLCSFCNFILLIINFILHMACTYQAHLIIFMFTLILHIQSNLGSRT